MAEGYIHKQEFVIRNLSTRSVTLSPSQAHVIRDIHNISLEPGMNEITIYGLTPTADESSIKVDGKGSATISDLTVELVANREMYEEIYPPESDSSETDEDPTGVETKCEIARTFAGVTEKVHSLIKEAKEDRDSATEYLDMLSDYGKSVSTCPAKDLHEHMEAYRKARKDAFNIKTASEKKLKGLEDSLAKLLKDNRQLAKAVEQEKKAVEKAKRNRSVKKQLASQEKLKATHRLREERSQFWPRKVYQVVLTLDTNWDVTPGSSRRGSIDNFVKLGIQPPPRASPSTTSSDSVAVQYASQISLSLSYITHAASWSPRYDLSLSTPGRCGTITYQAEFSNQTSESWRDAKVILSTSQTTFQSLSEPIPTLLPWQIRLSKLGTSDTGDEALMSRNEVASKTKGGHSAVRNSKESRHALFGVDSRIPSMPSYSQYDPDIVPYSSTPRPAQQHAQMQSQMQQSQMQSQMQQSQMQSQMQQSQMQSQIQAQMRAQMQARAQAYKIANSQPLPAFGLQAPQVQQRGNLFDSHVPQDLGSQHSDLDAESITSDDLIMSFEESAWEETGLTATYDVPGLRTIPPSNTTRRHRIASVALQDVRLSYILVPKLREAAFLQAWVRNSSSITLLKGPAGLTLDGSFLGNITLPHCSAGQSFHLNLGVDPAVRVVYQKPAVHHRQVGLFQKEGSGVYRRVVTVRNNKTNAAVEGVVLDQIPVSEDERLRVEICQPKGLRVEGDRVACGIALEGADVGRGDGSGPTKSGFGWRGLEAVIPAWDEQSGKPAAVATLKQGGQVCWEFKLGTGKAMRLGLEYETHYPTNEKAV